MLEYSLNIKTRNNKYSVHKLILFLFGVFSFFLGTGYEKLTVYSLILLTVFSFLSFDVKKVNLKKEVVIFYLFFLIILIYSLVFKEYKYIERNISFFLFPLLMLNINKELIKKAFIKNIIFYSFSLGLLFYSFRIIIYYLVTGTAVETGAPLIWYSFYDLKRVLFSNNELGQIFHSVYYSVYSICSVLFLIFNLKYVKHKWLSCLLIFFHIIFVFIAASRISYITITILILIFIIKIKNKKISVSLLLITVLSFFCFSKLVLNNEYSYLYHKFVEDVPYAVDFRINLWSNSCKIFFNNLKGIGFKNFHEELHILNSTTLPQGPLGSEGSKYNAHNLFLEFFCALGMIGGFYFIFVIRAIFKRALEKKNETLFYLIVTLSISFLTESFLLRQYGIIFFMFFVTLFWNNKIEKTIS
ncbi:O-antigen ligase family protein [Algibacter aquimarinus]|uniref:O-antigen ligase-related domain-containing protein n=1 Tax=Algibacter aquimarinus TaxID=1136748 RepID=A0ABP9HCW7_9FLAO